jgi:hypothetical protein
MAPAAVFAEWAQAPVPPDGNLRDIALYADYFCFLGMILRLPFILK